MYSYNILTFAGTLVVVDKQKLEKDWVTYNIQLVDAAFKRAVAGMGIEDASAMYSRHWIIPPALYTVE